MADSSRMVGIVNSEVKITAFSDFRLEKITKMYVKLNSNARRIWRSYLIDFGVVNVPYYTIWICEINFFLDTRCCLVRQTCLLHQLILLTYAANIEKLREMGVSWIQIKLQ